MSYTRAVTEYEAKTGGVTVVVRKDYCCKAYGCPNAGSIEDLCYFHWRSIGDPSRWPEITQSIRENFDEKRNWGQFSPERQAMHRAASQKLMARLSGKKPHGDAP